MSFNVSTAVFAGPLDLLLQLITRHQVNITEVSLTAVVEEYLLCLDEMADFDLEVTSEFILIAATLIELKAHYLLPAPSTVDLDEELALNEERDRLLSRLLLCVTFKDVAAVFLRRLAESSQFLARTGGLDQAIPHRPRELVLPVDGNGLRLIANRVLERAGSAPDLDHLDLDLPSVEEAMADIQGRMAELVQSSFDELVGGARRRSEVAAYFLALLELARWGLLRVAQDEWLGPIRIEHRAAPIVDLRSA
ncbi:MAG: segregation and condensation protein A [Acidimicrobiia bacterium]